MKKITILMIMLCASVAAFAQFEQGRMLVGGSLGFDTQKETDKYGSTSQKYGTYTSFSLAPQFGYFIIDNLAVGGTIDLSLSKFKPEDDDVEGRTSTSIEIQPTVRYYLPQGIFFQGQFGIGTQKTKYTEENISEEYKDAITSFGVAAGYAFFLNDNIAIEPLVGYARRTEKEKDSSPTYKEIYSGLFLRVGIQVYLDKF
jgi:outer membrane protein